MFLLLVFYKKIKKKLLKKKKLHEFIQNLSRYFSSYKSANQIRLYENRSHLDTSFNQNQRLEYPESFWKFQKKNLTWEKKSDNLYE